MAVSIVPLFPSEPDYRFTTTLANVQFTFDVRWNSRDNDGAGAWYMDMYDADGVLMIAGEKLVLGAFIGRKSTHVWFGENVLALIDTTLDELDAGLDDMGVRILLQHYPIVDLLTEYTAT